MICRFKSEYLEPEPKLRQGIPQDLESYRGVLHQPKYESQLSSGMEQHIELISMAELKESKDIANDSGQQTNQNIDLNISSSLCKICNKNFMNLDLHIEKIHNLDRPFECSICQRRFITKHNLRNHMAIHANNRLHKCPYCPKSFNFPTDIRKHLRTHGTDCPFQCEICGASFKFSYGLRVHRRSHTGDKPYKCYKCDRSYTTSHSLNLHIRIHNNERPFACPTCNKSFTDRSTLKIHKRCHTGENPFICHLCGKTTKQASNLKSHYKHYHKIFDISCKNIRDNSKIFFGFKNAVEKGQTDINISIPNVATDENITSLAVIQSSNFSLFLQINAQFIFAVIKVLFKVSLTKYTIYLGCISSGYNIQTS